MQGQSTQGISMFAAFCMCCPDLLFWISAMCESVDLKSQQYSSMRRQSQLHVPANGAGQWAVIKGLLADLKAHPIVQLVSALQPSQCIKDYAAIPQLPGSPDGRLHQQAAYAPALVPRPHIEPLHDAHPILHPLSQRWPQCDAACISAAVCGQQDDPPRRGIVPWKACSLAVNILRVQQRRMLEFPEVAQSGGTRLDTQGGRDMSRLLL